MDFSRPNSQIDFVAKHFLFSSYHRVKWWQSHPQGAPGSLRWRYRMLRQKSKLRNWFQEFVLRRQHCDFIHFCVTAKGERNRLFCCARALNFFWEELHLFACLGEKYYNFKSLYVNFQNTRYCCPILIQSLKWRNLLAVAYLNVRHWQYCTVLYLKLIFTTCFQLNMYFFFFFRDVDRGLSWVVGLGPWEWSSGNLQFKVCLFDTRNKWSSPHCL